MRSPKIFQSVQTRAVLDPLVNNHRVYGPQGKSIDRLRVAWNAHHDTAGKFLFNFAAIDCPQILIFLQHDKTSGRHTQFRQKRVTPVAGKALG